VAPPTWPETLERTANQAAAVQQRLQVVRSGGPDLEAGKATPVARVDEKTCTLCGACQAVCPTEAITLGEVAVRVNAEVCCGCGACVEVCPKGAIRLN